MSIWASGGRLHSVSNCRLREAGLSLDIVYYSLLWVRLSTFPRGGFRMAKAERQKELRPFYFALLERWRRWRAFTQAPFPWRASEALFGHMDCAGVGGRGEGTRKEFSGQRRNTFLLQALLPICQLCLGSPCLVILKACCQSGVSAPVLEIFHKFSFTKLV